MGTRSYFSLISRAAKKMARENERDPRIPSRFMNSSFCTLQGVTFQVMIVPAALEETGLRSWFNKILLRYNFAHHEMLLFEKYL